MKPILAAIALVAAPAWAQPPAGIIAEARAYCDARVADRQDAIFAEEESRKYSMANCLFSECRRRKGALDLCMRVRNGP